MLVVHRQPSTAEAIRRHVATWGADTTVCASVAEAARDAVDVDVAVLPLGADAAELAADLDALGRALPVVAVAPLSNRLCPEELADGVAGVVSAPAHRSSLRDALLAALRKAGR